MFPTTYTKIVLNERPKTVIEPTTFRKETANFDELRPGNGQALIQVSHVSLDPAMRGWLRDVRSYLPPVQINETMRAGGIGVVIKTGPNSVFSVGDHVYGAVGWAEFTVMDDAKLTKLQIAPGIELMDFINTLGSPGLTAYFGLQDVGKLKSGETLVVSGAAGAVGSLVCQLGKRIGAKVYAFAGSDEKCAWLEQELGVDKAFNYKSDTFFQDFKSIGYLDVYFDNVGGPILDSMLTRLNKGARIVMCGAISQYNSEKPEPLHNYQNMIAQRARMEGFIVFDYNAQYPAAIREMSGWLADGSIMRKFHVVDGLENAPGALELLFTGGNTGKLVVKVSDGPDLGLLKANM